MCLAFAFVGAARHEGMTAHEFYIISGKRPLIYLFEALDLFN
jgi:hypothetical protein